MGTRSSPMRERVWRRAVAGSFLLLAAASPGFALEEPPDELPALKACEKRLCTMILDKKPVGDDFACEAQKTWAKSTLEEGKSKGIDWGFGDARCKVDLKLARKDIVDALTKRKHTIRVPAHDVNCIMEREGELRPVTARLAPKLTFKDGKADKVWINLETIEGPDDVKSTIWTAAKLEDTLGIFHRPMIKSINKFLHRQCARRYGPDGQEAKAAKKKKAKGKAKVAAPAKKDAPKKDATEAVKPATATASAP